MKAPSKRGNTVVNVYLLLIQNNQLCLGLRKNTQYLNGYWGLISGHVEEGESATQGMIREAYEEAGLVLKADDLKVVHILHRKSDRLGIDVFFACPTFEGEPVNQEPHKCERLAFFPLDALPSNIMPYVGETVSAIQEGKIYSEIGWEK